MRPLSTSIIAIAQSTFTCLQIMLANTITQKLVTTMLCIFAAANGAPRPKYDCQWLPLNPDLRRTSHCGVRINSILGADFFVLPALLLGSPNYTEAVWFALSRFRIYLTVFILSHKVWGRFMDNIGVARPFFLVPIFGALRAQILDPHWTHSE